MSETANTAGERLQIYRARSGQWAGRMMDANGTEIAGIAGCSSPEEVEQTAYDSGFFPDEVEVLDKA